MTLAPSMLLAGSVEVVEFKVAHGCGALPTTAFRVVLPAGVEAVEPQPKAGWTLAVEPATGATPRAATWSGGTLPAHEAGVFSIRMKVPQAPGMLLFPALQTCEDITAKTGSSAPRTTHHQGMLVVVPAGSAKQAP